MARTINTQAAGYQTRLAQLQDIKAFYGPVIKDYLEIRDREAQKRWRQADPILRELLEIWWRIQNYETGPIPDDI